MSTSMPTISKLNNNQKRNLDWVIHILSSSTLYLLQIHQSKKQLPFVCSQKLMIDHDKDVCNWCNNFLVKFYTFLKLYIVTCFLPCAYYIWLKIFWTFSTLRFSSPPFQGSEPLLALQLVLPERLIVIKVMMTTNSLIQEWQQWVWVYFMDDNSDNHKVWVCVCLCYRVSCLSCLKAGKTDENWWWLSIARMCLLLWRVGKEHAFSVHGTCFEVQQQKRENLRWTSILQTLGWYTRWKNRTTRPQERAAQLQKRVA